jgi:tetrahedral aminopeptidase
LLHFLFVDHLIVVSVRKLEYAASGSFRHFRFLELSVRVFIECLHNKPAGHRAPYWWSFRRENWWKPFAGAETCTLPRFGQSRQLGICSWNAITRTKTGRSDSTQEKTFMDLLERLTQTPSVPGREARIRAVIEEYVTAKTLFDEIHTDAMGSLIAVRKARPLDGQAVDKPVKVMLAAHMDQIGFLVRHIDDNGFVRLNPVGGFDTRNLFARTVRVCAKDGDLPGVMNPGGRPIHIATEEEKKKVPLIGDFFVDLGISADDVRAKVQIGDMVVLDGPFHHVGDYVVSQCLDNRVGCWAQIRALENLSHHSCDIYAAWTVQEEVGLRGATAAAFGIDPDIGIACDTTLCCKTPGVPDEDRVTVPGDGVALHVMDSSMISDIGLIEDLERIAAQKGIKYQRAILPRGGQDGAAIQRSRSGVRTVSFACPVKYIHTVTEMSHKDDLESYPALLTAWLETL